MTTLRQHSSQCTCNVTLAPEKPTYSDSSGAIFSMYIAKGQKFDKENADNWDGQANGILLFVCSCSLPISLIIFFLRLLSFSISSRVSSPPPWLLLLLSATRTCSKIPVLSCQFSHRYPDSLPMRPPMVSVPTLPAYQPKFPSSLPCR